ncbi:hypothetical protein HY008_03390, partial [Candidatus Woesebacteria bacterium]|nr:hypothetical protein [Candidatus Woesebacteria bacterium]
MANNKKRLSNYDFFLKVDTAPYKGEWIAITDKKVVAHGKDAGKVYNTAKKKAYKKNISLAKIPDEQML